MDHRMRCGFTSLAVLCLGLTSVPARAQQGQVELTAAAEPQAQVKDDFFESTQKFAQGATQVNDVNLGPEMLALVAGSPAGDTARKLNYIIVHSYEYAKPGMYKAEDVEALRQKLRSGNWNCFIHSANQDTGESSDICTRPSPDRNGNEMVILDIEPKELSFVHISGSMSLADLAKLRGLGGNHPPPPPPVPPSAPAAPAPPPSPAPPK